MTKMTTPAFNNDHDHQHCIQAALGAAESLCARRGCRLTAVRRRVLELIWQHHRPLGAYELLGQISQEGFNSAPPTVYRALDFLVAQGLVHRIASLNAFIGCAHPEEPHTGYFLICRHCGSTAEEAGQRLSRQLRAMAAQEGFRVESETLELIGLCGNCREDDN